MFKDVISDDVIFYQNNSDLIIAIKEDGKTFEELADKITVKNWTDIYDSVENFTFSDNITLNKVEVEAIMISPNDDVINGSDADEIHYGKAGNDTINSGLGNDILDGGIGDDQLNGSRGDDTYIFGRGYGQDTILDEYIHWSGNDAGNDTILFKDGISTSDILFSWEEENLIVDIGNNDKLTIQNQTNSNYSIENFELSDGSYLSSSDVEILIQNMISFADENGIDLSNKTEVRNNAELMTLVANSWNAVA